MFEELKRKYAHFIIRRKYLKKNEHSISYIRVLSDASDFFIIMPKAEIDFIHALDIIRYYQIHKKIITLFLPKHKYNLIPDKGKYKFIPYDLLQINQINLPNSELKLRLKPKEFDVVMDLNRSEEVFFSAVANIVKSKVRVSFKKENSENYYNLLINDKQTNSEAAYRNFMNYLKMF